MYRFKHQVFNHQLNYNIMFTKEKVQALVNLLDDTDQEVYDIVRAELLGMGGNLIPMLHLVEIPDNVRKDVESIGIEATLGSIVASICHHIDVTENEFYEMIQKENEEYAQFLAEDDDECDDEEKNTNKYIYDDSVLDYLEELERKYQEMFDDEDFI